METQPQKVTTKKRSLNVDEESQLRKQVMVKALQKLDDSKNKEDNKDNNVNSVSSDDLFGKLIGQSISEIPDGYKKELLKVQIQQLILQTKFMALQSHSLSNTNSVYSAHLVSPTFGETAYHPSFGSPFENSSNISPNLNKNDMSFHSLESFQ